MDKLDLTKKKTVYFIGIGGISMSAIALILYKNGFKVLGSDFKESDDVKKIKNIGIKVNIGHKKENITDDIDIVVYSKAIHDDNEEIIEAKKKGICLLSRSEILGMLMANYAKRICVSGTHGKTTTTAIISKVMLDKGLNPTINVGGIVDEVGGNTHIGDNNDLFIAEACEYTNSFLDFCPTIGVVTNIELDHTDFFKDINDIRNSFKKFIELIPEDGALVINDRIDNIDGLVSGTKVKVITYGSNEKSNYYYKNIRYDEEEYQLFDVYRDGKMLGTMRQKLIGKHNVLNFLAAFATLAECGVSFSDMKSSIEDFKGAHRRLEVKGVINGVTYIDDYAHHPTEIEASLLAIKELKYEHLFIIFQPHTYTRTKSLYKEFVRVLGMAENVILAKIYAAREKDLGIISSKDVCDGIIADNQNENNFCEYLDTFEKISEYVAKNARKNDIVVTMGAGDVYRVFDYIKNNIQK